MMTRSTVRAVALILAATSTFLTGSALAADPASKREGSSPLVEPFLTEGRLAAGEAALEARLKEEPEDDQARFSLGVVRVLRAAENVVQSLHRYGMRSRPGGMPFVRLPVPPNSDPEEVSYEEVRAIAQRFVDDLAEAEATLAKVDDPDVKLPLRFGRVRMDFDGDGEAEAEETLWRIYRRTVSA